MDYLVPTAVEMLAWEPGHTVTSTGSLILGFLINIGIMSKQQHTR